MENVDEELVVASFNHFQQGEHADCAVKCGAYEWKVHKSILCPRNDYFKAAFEGHFEEGSTSTVDWNDEEPWAAAALLIFLYTYNYPRFINVAKGMQQELGMPASNWLYHWGVFVIADKRQTPKLKELAKAHLIDAMHNGWDEEAFIELVPIMWAHDDDDAIDIRRWAVDRALHHQSDLVKNDSFFEMISEVDGFMKSWVSKVVRQNRRLQNQRLRHQPPKPHRDSSSIMQFEL